MRTSPRPWYVLVALAACARPSLQEPAATPVAVYDAFQRHGTDSLWPGFHPRRIAVAVYDLHATWLFGHPQPPADFVLDPETPEAVVYRGRHPVVTTNTATDLAGVPTAAVILRVDVNPRADAWAGIAIHEAFHVFQAERHRDWRPNEVDLFTYPRDDHRNLTQRRLETESLRRALTAGDFDSARCWAGRAMDHRATRYAALPPESARYERESERLEGLADYVELRALSATVVLSETGYPPDAVRSRSYAMGAGLAFLLDRFVPGWPLAVERGDDRYLDVILTEALGSARCVPGVAIDADSVARVATTDLETWRTQLAADREAFLRQSGWSATVIADRTPLLPAAFDPLNLDVLNGREVLHRRFVRLTNDVGGVEVYEHPSLTRAIGDHPLFGGVRVLVVTGLSARPVLRRDAGELVLEAGPMTGRFADAEVSWGPGTVRIRLRRGEGTGQ